MDDRGGALSPGFLAQLQVWASSKDKDGQIFDSGLGANVFEYLEATAVRHDDIEHDQVRPADIVSFPEREHALKIPNSFARRIGHMPAKGQLRLHARSLKERLIIGVVVHVEDQERGPALRGRCLGTGTTLGIHTNCATIPLARELARGRNHAVQNLPRNIRLFQDAELMPLEGLLGGVVVFHAQTQQRLAGGLRNE